MEDKVPEYLMDKLAEKVGLNLRGSEATQLLVYGGTSVLLGQFLQIATGSTSLAKLDLQGFQLQQIHREVQAVHEKVKVICNHKSQAAVDFFLRGEYEAARNNAILGFRSASDIEHKVIATRIKMLAEILMEQQRMGRDWNISKENSGMTIKRCLDELFDDSMVSSCWNTARKYRLMPNNIGETKKKLDLVDELLMACYPIMSYCLGWTDPEKQLELIDDNQALAKLNTKYLTEGEEDKISIFFGKFQNESMRMDVYKTVNNQLKCKLISANCFQPELSFNIKSRPQKGGWLKIMKRKDTDRLEFDLQKTSHDDEEERSKRITVSVDALFDSKEVLLVVGGSESKNERDEEDLTTILVSKDAGGKETSHDDEEETSKIVTVSVDGLSDSKDVPLGVVTDSQSKNEKDEEDLLSMLVRKDAGEKEADQEAELKQGGEKAANLTCCLRDICKDNNEMWEDDTLDKYAEIVGCNACFSDENEDGYLFHPECYEKKHCFLNSNTKDKHRNSRKVLKTIDLKKLSKAERIMKLKTDMTLTFNTMNTILPSLPNAAAAAIAVGKGITNMGVVNVVDEIGSIAFNLGQSATLGLGAGLSAAALVIELGYQARQWSKGTITSSEFKMKGIQAAVGTLSSFTCATIGTLIGTAVGGPGLGTFIGGVIGAIVGAVAGYTSRIIVEWGFDYDEDSKRSDLIIEAFNFLDLPAFHLINEKVVEQSFRKMALECHPDSVRVKARDARERSIAEIEWQLLQHAKDVSLGFFKNKHCFSPRCKDTIQKKYDPRDRVTTTFNGLKDSLDESAKSSQNKLIV